MVFGTCSDPNVGHIPLIDNGTVVGPLANKQPPGPAEVAVTARDNVNIMTSIAAFGNHALRLHTLMYFAFGSQQILRQMADEGAPLRSSHGCRAAPAR